MSAIKKTVRPKPVVLITLEGFGIAPVHSGNVITEAKPPYFNHLLSHYPALSLKVLDLESKKSVHNSVTNELSHVIMGLGRPPQDLFSHIDEQLATGNFEKALEGISPKLSHQRLHILGLISNSNLEASINHLEAIIQWLEKKPHQAVFLHVVLDGRDMSPKGGQKLLVELEKKLASVNGLIATVTGRVYALDLHQHESRIQKTVEALVYGKGNKARSSSIALKESYGKKIFDEEFPPTIIMTESETPVGSIRSEDIIIFLNVASLAIRPLVEKLLTSFQKSPEAFSLGDYGLDKVHPLFQKPPAKNTLGEVISEAGFRQLRISDSEGFADITISLNGGFEKPFVGEDRCLVRAPLMETYSTHPSFSNEELAKETIKGIEENKYDFIAVHFSNVDRVAHSGDIAATTAAIISTDNALHKIVGAVLETPGVVLITGSHGIAEQMGEQSEKVFIPHSNNNVPFILVGKQFAGYSLGLPEAIGGDLSLVSPAGSLIDIAPTILKLMRLPIPKEMTGKSFFDELRLV